MKKKLYRIEALVKAVEYTLLFLKRDKQLVKNFKDKKIIENYIEPIIEILNPYEVDAFIEKEKGEKEEKRIHVSWTDGNAQKYMQAFKFSAMQKDFLIFIKDKKEVSLKEVKVHMYPLYNLTSGSAIGALTAGISKKEEGYNLPKILKVEKRNDDLYYSIVNSAKEPFNQYLNNTGSTSLKKRGRPKLTKEKVISTPKKRGRPSKKVPESTSQRIENTIKIPSMETATHILRKANGIVIRKDGNEEQKLI